MVGLFLPYTKCNALYIINKYSMDTRWIVKIGRLPRCPTIYASDQASPTVSYEYDDTSFAIVPAQVHRKALVFTWRRGSAKMWKKKVCLLGSWEGKKNMWSAGPWEPGLETEL